LEKRRVEARVVVTSAVFDLSWLPAVSAAAYGDAESATKLHLGRVGVDVLWKISGREIDGQDAQGDLHGHVLPEIVPKLHSGS
jgi:hypothetical protein